MIFSNNQRVLLLFFSAVGMVAIVVIFFLTFRDGEDRSFNNPNSHSILFHRKYTDSNIIVFNKVIEFNNSIYRLWSFADKLYVQNWDECNIIKTDTLGNRITTFGRKGRAPGEFLAITDVSINGKYLTVIDHRNLTVSVFADNGRIMSSNKLGFGITSGTKISQDLYLFKSYNMDKKDTESFSLFNSNDKKVKTFSIPRLLKSQAPVEASNIELAGFYVKRNSSYIFRIYSFVGQFTAFDTTGKLIYQMYSIDKSPLPKVIIRGSGKDMMIMPASRDINIDGDADEQYLYLLSNASTPDVKMIAPGTNAQGIIDIYDVNNGEYLCSMKIPIIKSRKDTLLEKSSPLAFSVCNNRIYVVQGIGVYCFTFDRSKILVKHK
jgi:hypothetical protein